MGKLLFLFVSFFGKDLLSQFKYAAGLSEDIDSDEDSPLFGGALKKEAQQRFQQLADAYRILSDPELRERYDQLGRKVEEGVIDAPCVDPLLFFGILFGSEQNEKQLQQRQFLREVRCALHLRSLLDQCLGLGWRDGGMVAAEHDILGDLKLVL
eukprot:s524_g8.t1